MKVVHLHRKPFPGMFSIEVLFENLRKAMRGECREITRAVVPLRSKGVVRRLANIAAARRERGDVFHVTGDVHYVVLGLPPDRTILTIHDCRALERLTGIRRWGMRVLWFDLPTRRAAVVTVVSEETKGQLLRHVRVPEEKVVVIPNAASPIFRPSPRPFHAGCPRILHIGTAPNKNLSRLIEALRGLDCHLTVVGLLDHAARRRLDASHIAYDWQANLDEEAMYRVYCESDIVSFVSTYEGFGMPIIEAQWVERPVVTSNCSSMPEVAGEGACLVDPFDVASIRRGLDRVIGDAGYRDRLVEQGRRNRERFSLAAVASQYLALYQRLRPDA